MKLKIPIPWVIGATALLLAASLALLWFVYRPWALNWGASNAEIARPMPGDDIVPEPTFNATRAVTIDASPAEIWPWLVQIGKGRAGFYSYDRLDNDGIPSSDTIMPLYQDLQEGDPVPLSDSVDALVTLLVPESAMLLEIRHDDEIWTWAWGLYPTEASQTRLVTRLRVNAPGIRSRMMLDFFEIIMMRKCLLGIKQRAEALGTGDREAST
jgi:hypothetical protein